MLISLLILIGSTVLMLLIIWLTSRIFAVHEVQDVILLPIGEGGGMMGDSMEMASPNVDETDLQQPELTDVLAAITDAVAAKSAILDNPALYSDIRQKGGGRGDGRLAGSGGGRPGRPRHWEVRFLGRNTAATYARQLDFFRIELGVLMRGNRVEYASKLSQSRPQRRSGPASEEKRYYLTWRQGELQEADRELLGRAGIDPGRRLILKFLPPEVELHLVKLEQEYATRRGEQINDIRATYFGIQPAGQGYAFYVIDQTYK